MPAKRDASRRGTSFARFRGIAREQVDFERFVDRLPCPDGRSRARLRLVGGELFDNLVRHAAPLRDGVTVTVASCGVGMTLSLAFSSRRFRDWLKAPGPSLPSWSPAERRWRGLGLIMVRNLCARVEHRAGPAGDRIVATF